MQKIILTDAAANELKALIHAGSYDKIFVLYDDNTERHCRQRIESLYRDFDLTDIVIRPSDAAKNVETLADVWRALQEGGASRRSLLVCVGGGMVTDLGGFAAATFKRGIDFFNVPTTLLAMVDAAVGGKTGINFGNLKNEVGAFREAETVVIDAGFLSSLDSGNMRSGFAEMLKHSLLASREMWLRHIKFDLDNPDTGAILPLVGESIKVKSGIVEQDPRETGLRKALNFGHTFGHALETLAMERGRTGLHGYFVAWGMVAELFLSCTREGFPQTDMRNTVRFVKDCYGEAQFTCKDYERIYELMVHDKKNAAGRINCTLLSDIGSIKTDCRLEKDEIFEALDFLREG